MSLSNRPDWKLIEDLLKMKTDTLIIEYLTEMKSRVIELIDDRGYTLLHFAVLALRPDMIHSIVRFAKDVQHENSSRLV